MVWATATVRVTDTCWIDSHIGMVVAGEPSTIVYAQVGDDGSMNGMDSPATLRSPEDVSALIASLEKLRENWPRP